MSHVVDDPDVPLRIVRTDVDLVRPASPLEKLVPLVPRLDQFPVAVDHDDAVDHVGDRLRRGHLVEETPVAGKVVRDLVGELQLAAIGEIDAVG